ncbi:MAG: TonB-dependent receptor [Bacteroidota bacterium]|nr:TonB-dependent receptor [Bacteroidota bacterium]
MKKMQCLILMLLLFSCGNVIAQKVITGKVTDKAGQPLEGVSVVTNNNKGGTTTNQDGTFSVNVPSSSASLVFSFVGFTPQTVSIGSKSVLNIQLSPEDVTETEVVVIGYGTQKKSNVTGAVSKFKNERLDEAPVSRLDQALQGKIAGVQIQNVGSEAGVAPKIRIRGLSSINAGANPLVVVDGVPVPDGLNFVNSADVESVEVLKDAASAAIYGSRGASGVILITTKSGKSSKPMYKFKYSQGQKSAYKLYDIMTATEWANLLFSEAEYKKQDPTVPAIQLTTIGIAPNEDRAGLIIERDIIGKATNWQDYAIRNANVRNVELSVSGGNKDTRYYFSGIYQKDQGMMINSEYDRFSIRSKIDAQLSKRVKLSININPSYIKREAPAERLQDFVRFRSWLPIFLDEKSAAFVRQLPANANLKAGDWSQARYFSNQIYSGIMPDGSSWTSAPTTVVPFNTANQTPAFSMAQQKNTTDDFRLLSSADLSINILPGLDFKTLVSGYVTYTKGLNFSKRDATRAGDVNRGVYDDRINVDLLNENTLNYTKKFKAHNIGLLAGFTAQKTSLRDQRVVGLDYPSDDITTLNTALTIDRASSFNTRFKTGLLSYLGRITYAYQDKYLLAASFRRDGSSYFAPTKKWGNFPSVSVGWVASNENFLKKAGWLSNLKFRGSYGLSGNNRIVDFAYLDILFPANYALGAGTGTLTTGQLPSRDVLSNPDLTWERTFQYNGGMDLSLFKNAVSITLDVYESRTEALLLRQAAQAFTGVPFAWNNLGKLQNRGLELELTTNNFRRKNFTWTTSANISFNKNKVLELGDESRILNQGERTELYMNKVGAPLVQFFGYVTDGVWLSQAQIDGEIAKGLTSTLNPYFVPGGLKFKDINGDNKINTDDRTVIGNPYPDFTWGITNTFKYKGFDFSFLLQGVQGGQLVNGDANYLEIKRTTRVYSENRWISAMFPGDGKTPIANVGFQNWLLTDYALEDASYWALREVGMGYTFPKKWMEKAKLNGLRLYFSAQNLFFNSAKSFRALNPEARTGSGPYATPLVDGYQRGAFPVNKAFLFGIDINF